MAFILKEWLKEEQKVGAYYLFEDRQVVGEKFFNALFKKRGAKGFYLDEDTKKEGFMASVYGVYELLTIADSFFAEGGERAETFLKNFSSADQLSLANEIKAIYEHVRDIGFDFEPIISKYANDSIFRIRETINVKDSDEDVEEADPRSLNVNPDNTRQKYPYFGAMTWLLSLSSLLWKKYFSYTETGKFTRIDKRSEVISDAAAVKIIRSLESIIRDTIRHTVRLFAEDYIKPHGLMELNFQEFGDDNKQLIELAGQEGLKLGWGYMKGVKVPSLYFTFSILEAYSDFDSNILIGGDAEDYFDPTEDELAKGFEPTKNQSAYVRPKRLFDNLVSYINSDIKRDENGNEVIGPDGKPERIYQTEKRYEEIFRREATQCAYYLFYKFKDTIADSFYNDDGYTVTKEQVRLSSASSSVFYPLYVLSSLLNGEVNGTIKTQLMYTKRYRATFDALPQTDETMGEVAKADRQIKTLEAEFRQFENCFTDGLNNVQKMYSSMEKNNKLDSIDRHYLTFDQIHPDDPQFSRTLSRENILAMPLLPLLVNVTNLYVMWITKFPDKQLSAYVMDIFENYCNHDLKTGALEWVFEQGNYDLHTTLRYIDAISNFFTYYEDYERVYAERAKINDKEKSDRENDIKKAVAARVEEIQKQFNKDRNELVAENEELKRRIANGDAKFAKVFDIESSTLSRLAEILGQYVEGKKEGRDVPQSASIEEFFKAFVKAAVCMLSPEGSDSDKYGNETISGLKHLYERRGEASDNSVDALISNLVDDSYALFTDNSQMKSDQN